MKVASDYSERDAVKLKSALLLLLVVFLLSVDTHSAEKQKVFRSEANGYSVTIPEGWKRVPDATMRAHFYLALPEEGLDIMDRHETALAHELAEGYFLQYPYLLIQVVKLSDQVASRPRTDDYLAGLIETLTGFDMSDSIEGDIENHLSDDMRRWVIATPMILGSQRGLDWVEAENVGWDNFNLYDVSWDEDRMIYTHGREMDLGIHGKVKELVVGHIGRQAIVQLMFNCLEADWSRFENERNLMLNSFAFDKGMQYQHAPSTGQRILNAMDWVGAKGLIFAFVAVVFGLIVAVLRPAKRESNDQ